MAARPPHNIHGRKPKYFIFKGDFIMKKLNKDNKGFSLVELLVVIAIMVVLVGVIAPSLLSNIEKTREAKDYQALDTIAGNIQAAMVNEDVYNAIVALNGTAFDLKDAYTGSAFSGTDVANANAKLSESLQDALSVENVYKTTSVNASTGAITVSDAEIKLVASKTAKTAEKILVSVSTAGKVKVQLVDSSNATIKGKSVDFEVER